MNKKIEKPARASRPDVGLWWAALYLPNDLLPVSTHCGGGSPSLVALRAIIEEAMAQRITEWVQISPGYRIGLAGSPPLYKLDVETELTKAQWEARSSVVMAIGQLYETRKVEED